MNRTAAFIAVCVAGFAAQDAVGQHTPGLISAAALYDEFDQNNYRAETQYSGKEYIVTGPLSKVESSDFPFSHGEVTVMLSAGGTFKEFRGTLAAGENQKMLSFNKGDAIKLRCTLGGTILGDPTGKDCIVVLAEAAVPPTQQIAPFRPPMAVSPPVQPPSVPVALPAPSATPQAEDPDYVAFQRGKRDRAQWELFISRIVGDEHEGAAWWAGQRSLPKPGSCSSGNHSDEFQRGCQEAQSILTPSDVQRKSNPAYRVGWNSM